MGNNAFGDPQERVEEKRAWWFVDTISGKRIWPGQKYMLVKTYFDAMGRPPIHNLSWDRVYTINEYLVYQLTKDSKKKTLIGQEFTGDPQASLDG